MSTVLDEPGALNHDQPDSAGACGLPTGRPDEHGVDPGRLERAMAVVEHGCVDGAFPGGVALVARHGRVIATRAVGLAERTPRRRPMTVDALFDLASLTKVIAGVTVALTLLEAGVWLLDDAVARFIPAFGRAGKRDITVRHLLTHTSGLPPWLPCYTAARTLDETVQFICATDLDAAPGTQVQYSDLGMALIRALALTSTGEDLPSLLERAVFAPLGMRDTGYRPHGPARTRAVATEHGNRFEQGMVTRAGQRFDQWRDHVLVGEVNDGNAHHALGGVSSHAGLFATAGDLARFGQLYLQEGRWQDRALFSAAVVREATRLQTAGLQEPYGLGWRLNDRGVSAVPAAHRSSLTRAIFPTNQDAWPPLPLAGDLLSSHAYGHTGFTGVSLVIDPAYDLLLILLTNRIHPDASNGGIERVRARWHNAVAASIVS